MHVVQIGAWFAERHGTASQDVERRSEAVSRVGCVSRPIRGVQSLHDGNGQSVVEQAGPSSSYRLTANGDEAACAVKRGAEVSDGLSLLTIAPNCSKLMPGIERVKFWREQADGSVAFSENGIDPIVTFGVADGDG